MDIHLPFSKVKALCVQSTLENALTSKGNFVNIARLKLVSLPALVFSVLAGCAQSPGAIAPTSMGGAYDNLSCSKASSMLAAERPVLAALTKKQKDAVAGDAIGVFLVLVPVSSLTGNDVAGELATSKGKVNALEARLASCR